MNNRIARIALTPGEPGGIGPDICIALVQQSLDVQLVVFADPELLAQRAAHINLPLTLHVYDPEAELRTHCAGELTVVPVESKQPSVPGLLTTENAPYVLECIDQAVHACLDGHLDAVVTGPVHKGIINEAGIPFTGHTEYLAELSNTLKPVMMLQTSALRVALVTTHLPLSAISTAVTEQTLSEVITVLHTDLKRYLNKSTPAIFISGLNPHAGEGGHLGREEIDIIIPVIEKLRQQGMNLRGPLPADTMFSQENCALADVFLCMYHDQGLPVLKYQGFGEAVNVTLGLPFIRTSVDHGTALTLAGTGQASCQSLQYAIKTAIQMHSHSPGEHGTT